MTNSAYLFAGLLIGFISGSILVFIGMWQTAKAASGDRKAIDNRSIELMIERNRIDQAIAGNLKVLASWCEENWKR